MGTPPVERLAQEADNDDPLAGVDENCYVDRAQDLDFAHTSWHKFKEDLTNVCTNSFPRPIPEYARIHVVLLNWVEDNLGTIEELIKLENLFKEWFDCSTEVWRMPSSEQTEWELGLKLSVITGKYRGEDDLIVVYYGGHGDEDDNYQSIWQAYPEDTSPKLNWSSLQPTLLRAPCDVLILLDCCHAGAAARHNMLGTNELLAACVREQDTPGVIPTDFTEMIMRKIRSFGRQPFTIADLYHRLLKDRKRLQRTPQHYCFSSRDGRKLTLKPRQIAMTNGDQGPRMDASVSPSTSTPQSTSPMISPRLEYPRILLAISLRTDAEIPDIRSCTRWLTVDAPIEIQNVDIRIESAYDAHSTLILVSMPVEVWTYLPKISAYRFIDFICSSNLLPEAASEQWDEETQVGSVTTSSVSALVEGKYSPMVEQQETILPYTYLKRDPSIVSAQYTQSLYDICHLQSIRDVRVLVLRPGQLEDPIECTLLVWSLTDMISSDATTPYEALSHCWGPADSMREIMVYTRETTFSTSLKIRPELYAALQRLRDQQIERHVWVDAICINSENMSEKNSQVTLMPDIFHHASNVCIWLGAGSEDSTLAMRFIVRLVNLENFDTILKDHRITRELTALNSLMRREWFRKRWSFQVSALASKATLYCGDAEIDWSDFAVAVSLLEAVNIASISRRLPISENSRNIRSFLNGIEFLPAARLLDVTSDLFRKNGNRQILERCLSLEDLVCIFSYFQAPTPHDVIYSVLTLANNVTPMPVESAEPCIDRSVPLELEKELFIIDYDKTFVDVCKDFLTHTIKAQQSLDIICRPWVPEGSIADNERPSWLMTTKYGAFRQYQDGEYMRKNANALVGAPSSRRTRYHTNYHASRGSVVTNVWGFGFGPRAGSMYMEGFVIDAVKQKEAGAMNGIIPYDWIQAGGWDDNTALPPDRFWRTLVADRGPTGLEPPIFYRRACKAARDQTVRGGHINTSRLVQCSKGTIVANFARRVQEVIWMRRLITTERGLLGLAPAETKKRDLICILYGCSVPVVLRKHSDDKTGDEYFQFVGECYVHDLMDGEALSIQKNEEDKRKKETEEKEKEGEKEEGQESEEEKKGGHSSAKRTFELR